MDRKKLGYDFAGVQGAACCCPATPHSARMYSEHVNLRACCMQTD